MNRLAAVARAFFAAMAQGERTGGTSDGGGSAKRAEHGC